MTRRESWRRLAHCIVNGARAEKDPRWRKHFCERAAALVYAHSRRPETRAEAALLIRKLEGRG